MKPPSLATILCLAAAPSTTAKTQQIGVVDDPCEICATSLARNAGRDCSDQTCAMIGCDSNKRVDQANDYFVWKKISGSVSNICILPIKCGKEQRLLNTKRTGDGSKYKPNGEYIYLAPTAWASDRTVVPQSPRSPECGHTQSRSINSVSPKHVFDRRLAAVSLVRKSITFLVYRAKIPCGSLPFYKQVYILKLSVDGPAEPKVIGCLYGGQGSMSVKSWFPTASPSRS